MGLVLSPEAERPCYCVANCRTGFCKYWPRTKAKNPQYMYIVLSTAYVSEHAVSSFY